MELENDLIEFVSEVNKFYTEHKYIREPENFEFKDYDIEIMVVTDVGLSCNLKKDEKYLCSFEITLGSNDYILCFRMKDYSILWENGAFMYCTGLRDITHTPVFEGFKKPEMKICNDLDSSTVFQYRIIEEKADSLLILIDELRDMVSTNKYSTLYRVHTRV